jgi:hypothetical protein
MILSTKINYVIPPATASLQHFLTNRPKAVKSLVFTHNPAGSTSMHKEGWMQTQILQGWQALA